MGSKKKKQEKKKDFVKQKLRVGKNTKAANHTDTSFKAKTISLPKQSIGTKNVDHYISLTRHHSSSTRKEVLVALEKSVPEDATQRQKLMKSIIPMITDESRDVRDALLQLFETLVQTNYKLLEVNSKQLVLYIHSAMNHIDPSIHAMSIKFLTLVINEFPQPLIQTHFIKTMDGFYNLLNWSKLNRKQVNSKSTKVKINILANFKKFLQLCLVEEEDEHPPTNYTATTKYYVFPGFSNPFNQLNLFNSVDSTSTDILNRKNLVKEKYRDSILFHLKSMTDDNREITGLCNDIEVLLATVYENER